MVNTRSKTTKSSYKHKKEKIKRQRVKRPPRKPCAFVTNVLSKVDVLFMVLEFVGRGQYLFLCCVSKFWRSVYLKAREQEWECGEDPMATFISNAIGNDKACKTLEWSVKTGALNLAETRLMFNIKGRPGQPSEEKEQPAAFVVGAVSANLEGLLRALELGMPWNELVLDGAIRMSRVELLRSLGSPASDGDQDSRAAALENALRWRKRKRKDPHLLPVITSSTRYASTDILLWLHKRFWRSLRDSSTGMHKIAANSGRMEVSDLLWTLELPPPWDVPLIFTATVSNQIKYIEWALSQGLPWGPGRRGARCVRARELGATRSTLDILHAMEGYPCDCGIL